MLETGSTEWIGVAIHKELKHSVVTSFLNNNLLKNDQDCTVPLQVVHSMWRFLWNCREHSKYGYTRLDMELGEENTNPYRKMFSTIRL